MSFEYVKSCEKIKLLLSMIYLQLLSGPLDTKDKQNDTKLFARYELSTNFFITSSNHKALFIVAYVVERHPSRDLVWQAGQTVSDIPDTLRDKKEKLLCL